MMLPEVPGIIEGTMTINHEPDGRLSFRVLIGGQTDGCDLIELIITPEHLSRALGSAKAPDQSPTLPCHIGFCRSAMPTVG